MSNRVLRQKPRISYYEPEEPDLDHYIFCDSCGDFVYEYCSIHGSLLVVPDDKVNRIGVPAIVPRAALTIPKVFLHLAPSIIPGAGIGVFATLTLPRGVRFGPYRGKRGPVADSKYCWQVYSKDHKPSHVVDAVDSNNSNWMRYVNCARHWQEQNLVAFQYRGEIYYRTIKIIPRFTELMVFYGNIFARELQVDLARYNSPNGYAQKFGAPPIKKRKTNETKREHHVPETSGDTVANTEISQDISYLDSPSTQAKNIKETNAKIKPIFGKNNQFKKTTEKIKKKLKTNVIKKKNKKAETNTQKNTNKINQLLHETIVREEKVINKINTTAVYTSTKSNKINQLLHETFVREEKVINKINTTAVNTSTNSVLNTKDKRIDLYKHCEVCNLKCCTEDDLAKHKRFHDNSKPYVCEVCSYRFSCSNVLNRHKALVHKIGTPKEYFCQICNYKSKRQSHVKVHMRTHTGEKSFSCDICDYKFSHKNSLTRHIVTHMGEKPYSCDICCYRCTQKTSLTVHKRTHTNEKPYSCDICDYKCTHKISLTLHMRTHTGEKPFSCDICNFRSTLKENLKKHMRSHTGEKPFSCDICNYRSTLKGNLKKHMRSHTGEKPYSCDICSYRCTQKITLTRHMRTHTGEKPYSCDICSYRCTQKITLTRHMRTHTNEKPYSCDICDYRSATSSHLKQHLLNKHLNNKQK